ncbi:ABC transporter substrate-binding protein [Alkalihalobacillus sp. BA299]|uniref:ABC transporter substrate-binding protein n=1 Tax=Alkalihalobacillus sp. BA299 TaxID=2815938 RepID=UPI001ADB8A56|nr:ABC transporter substrate-binding protein [Alkalihalobacillus sp. BA299]
MKKFIGILAAAMIVISGCGGNGASGEGESNNSNDTGETAEVVKIGTLHPLSGGLATEGQEMRDGIRLAIEEVNEAGGIQSLNGAHVELVEADHEGVPEKGVSEVQRLDRDGVVGIIGTYASGVALPATQEAERAGIPFVIDIASANEITERGFQYTYRLQPPASLMAENFLQYFNALNEMSDTKLKTAILVHEDSIFGTSIAGLIEQKAEANGLEVLTTIPHSAATADLSTTINRIKSEQPDIVVATTYLRDGTLLINGINESGYKPKAIIGVANGAFSNAQFITEEAAINQHIMDVNYTINPQSDLANEVKENFKAQYNKNLSPNSAYSYTAAKVLIDAIERAGSTDREAIKDALKETNYSDHILPQDEIVFDENGQNANAQAVLSQLFDGDTKVVYPEQFKNEDPVYPAN